MTLPVVILAGGQGVRMGGGKPLRKLDGRPLVDHALGSARRWSGCIAVCVRQPDQIGAVGVTVITDAPGIAGPLAGLAAALDWAASQNCDRVLVVPCDMPFLPGDLASRLAGALTSGAGVAIPASGGHEHPICGVWRTSARPALEAQVAAGRLSLKGLAARVGQITVSWPSGPRDPFANLNTPAELAEAEGG